MNMIWFQAMQTVRLIEFVFDKYWDVVVFVAK